MRLLLCRSVGRVVTISTGTARAITILRVIIASRIRYIGSRPVRTGVNRTWIGNSRCRPVGIALVRIARIRVGLVRPVHPRVIAVNFYNIALLLLWLWVTCCLCQLRRVISVYGSADVLVAVSDARVRVSSFISYGVNYSSRAWPVVTVSGRAHNSRPVNVDGIVTDHRFTVVAVIDIVNTHWVARITANFIWPWTAYIGNPVVDISIIDNGSLVDDVDHTRTWYIIPGYVRAANISLWCTYPVIIGHVIPAAK